MINLETREDGTVVEVTEWYRGMARDGKKVHTVRTGGSRSDCGVRIVRRVSNKTPHTCERCYEPKMDERVLESGRILVDRWKE